MFDWIKTLFLSKYLGSVVRGLFKVASGFLIGTIGLDPVLVQQFVDSGTAILIAVILYLVGQAASFAAKKKE